VLDNFAEATIWIQEDLEKVKYAAAKFQYTSLTTTANAGQGSINVASVDGFVVNTLKVGSDFGTYTIEWYQWDDVEYYSELRDSSIARCCGCSDYKV